jgi:pentatricopeptide repeat protein
VKKAVDFVDKIIVGKVNSIIQPDEVTFNTLLKGCAQQKMYTKSHELYSTMCNIGLVPNQVTYNSLIEVYVRCGRIDDAWSMLTLMRSRKVKPDNFTLSSLIKGIKPYRDYWNQNGNNACCKDDPRVGRAIFLV